ncbi:MAG: hypothetical protein IJ542_02775 [Clostridia bacterium]|nr:hypothetical protein [Clostridia bacterium]
MYNFFTKNVNKRAFIKALKEVEEEGYYVDNATNDNVVFTTNMSRAVSSLSGEEADRPYVQDEALDVSEFTPNLDNARIKPANPEALGEDHQFVKQSRSQFYEKLFADSDDAFLDGSKVQERGLLSNETDSLNSYFSERTKTNSQSMTREEIIRRTKEKLAQLNAAARVRAEQNKQIRLEEERVKAERISAIAKAEEEFAKQRKAEEEAKLALEKQAEQARLDQEAKMAALIEEEKTKKEEESKIKVEVVSPAPVVAAVATPKPVKKSTRKPRTTKKKRRYDADIVGGFNY